MIKVWVLITYMWTGYSGGPLIIDNLASKSECERVADNIVYISKTNPTLYRVQNISIKCIEVWKVK